MKKITVLIPVFLIIFLLVTGSTAQVTWDGGGDGISWSDADNWSSDVVPTGTDSVIIVGSATVNANSGSSALAVFVASGCTLNQNAALNITSGITIEAGAIYNWNGGNMQWVYTKNYGTMNFSSGGNRYLTGGVVVENYGTFSLVNTLYFSSGTVSNYGMIDMQSGGNMSVSGSGTKKMINNASGTYKYSGGASISMNVPIDNYGLIQCEYGTFNITAEKNMYDGTELTAEAGAVLDFNSNAMHLFGHITGSPSGDVLLKGNVVSHNAKIDFSGVGIFFVTGAISGDTLTNEGLFNLLPGNYKYLSGGVHFVNDGDFIMEQGSDIYFINGYIINNATFEMNQNARCLYSSSSIGSVQNKDLMKKLGAMKTVIAVQFVNESALQVDDGTLELSNTKAFLTGSDITIGSAGIVDLVGGLCTFEGMNTGVNNNLFTIRCNFESNNALLNYSGNGINWVTGSFNAGALINQNLFHIENGNYKYLENGSSLVNDGTLVFETDAQLYVRNGLLRNESAMTIEGGADMLYSGASIGSFINNGAFNKIGNPLSKVAIAFENSGQVMVDDGELNCSGSKYVRDGSDIQVTDDGYLHFTSGTCTFEGNVGGANLNLFIIDCNFESNGANIDFSDEGIQWRTGSFVGGGVLTNKNQFHFIAGNYKYVRDSSILINEDSLINEFQADVYFVKGVVQNDGIHTFKGASRFLYSSTSIGRVVNNGTLQKVEMPESSIEIQVDNNAILSVDDGTFKLSGAKLFNENTNIQVSADGLLDLNSSACQFNGATVGACLNQIRLDCDFTSVNGSLNISDNGIDWVRGSFVGGGTLTNIGTFNLINGNYKYMRDSSVIKNNGSLSFKENADVYMVRGYLINDGQCTFNVGTDVRVSGSSIGSIINSDIGVLNKIGGGTTMFRIPFNNQGQVTVEASELQTNSSFENSGTLAGDGTFRLNGAFTNIGVTSPGLSPGLLTFIGTYSQAADGALNIELNGLVAGTEYDQVASSANASVDGDLLVSLGFQPTAGDVFQVVTAPGFSLCNLPSTTRTCYDDEYNAFDVNCEPTAIELEYIGLTAPDPLVCQSIDVYLDASGNATITPEMLLAANNDTCGLGVLSVDKSSFDCSDVGTNTVVLSSAGAFPMNCNATVTVHDTVKPVVSCMSGLSFDLDATGNVTIDASAIDDNSSDACGVTLSIDIVDFSCTDVGAQSVTLTATDPSGNSRSCTTSIMINDNIAPEVNLQDVTVTLDPVSGMATITSNMIDNGSTDACGIQSIDLSASQFDCSSVPMETIQVTVTDVNGNSAVGSADVTVIDNTAPTLNLQDVTVTLDPVSGMATITSNMVDNGSTDACGIQSIDLSATQFDCSSVPMETIQVTVTDVNGNSAVGSTDVTVIDNTAPEVNLQDVTVTLDPVSGVATITSNMVDNGSTDACGIQSIDLSAAQFDCSSIPIETIQVTVTDVNGNSAVGNVDVTVIDNTAPTLNLQDVTVSLDEESGEAQLTSAMVDNGSTDACGIQSISLSSVLYDCDSDSEMVDVTVTDINGNSAVGSVQVTVVKPQVRLIWVNEAASGTGFGLSKEHAFLSLSDALEASNGCVESPDSLFIVEGTYALLPSAMRTESFEINDQSLFGGFPIGAGARNPQNNVTILSGNVGAQGNNQDNVRNVVKVMGGDNVVDGFTIRDGYDDGMSGGAGVLCLANLLMKDCLITNNFTQSEGAGMLVPASGSVTMEGSVRIENMVGGASNLFVEQGGELDVNGKLDVD